MNIELFTSKSCYSAEEKATADREAKLLKTTIERLKHSRVDNLRVAWSLLTIINDHGENSAIYKDWLLAIKNNLAGWDDQNFRKNVRTAVAGLMRLPGCPEEKFALAEKSNASFSALQALSDAASEKLWDLNQRIREEKRFPTAQQIHNYNDTGTYVTRGELKQLRAERSKQRAKDRREEREWEQQSDATPTPVPTPTPTPVPTPDPTPASTSTVDVAAESVTSETVEPTDITPNSQTKSFPHGEQSEETPLERGRKIAREALTLIEDVKLRDKPTWNAMMSDEQAQLKLRVLYRIISAGLGDSDIPR